MSFSKWYQKSLDICSSPRFFGETASYLAKGAAEGTAATDIQGVPTRELLEIYSGNGVPSKGHRARFGVNLKRLNDANVFPAEGDTLTIKGVKFLIKDIDKDGEGGAAFVLSKQKE